MANPFLNRSQLAVHHAVSVGQAVPMVAMQRTVVAPVPAAAAAVHGARDGTPPSHPVQTAQRVALSSYRFL